MKIFETRFSKAVTLTSLLVLSIASGCDTFAGRQAVPPGRVLEPDELRWLSDHEYGTFADVVLNRSTRKVYGALSRTHQYTGRYRVVITLSSSLAEREDLFPLRVDLIGVPLKEIEQWRRQPVDEYFRREGEHDEPRNRKRLRLDSASSVGLLLGPDDPIWLDWEEANAIAVFVIADLPMADTHQYDGTEESDMSDEASRDSRIRELLLWRALWRGMTIHLRLDQTGLRLQTVPAQPRNNVIR